MLACMRIGVSLVAFLAAVTAHANDGLHITLADLAQPRDSIAVSRHPVLRTAVTPLLQDPYATLRLRYPGGDEGSLRAGELRAWLVALGIEAERIALQPGSSAPDRIDLDITSH